MYSFPRRQENFKMGITEIFFTRKHKYYSHSLFEHINNYTYRTYSSNTKIHHKNTKLQKETNKQILSSAMYSSKRWHLFMQMYVVNNWFYGSIKLFIFGLNHWFGHHICIQNGPKTFHFVCLIFLNCCLIFFLQNERTIN